jgi:5-methylcytosine-specific restriction endonuclease McrA
VICHHLRQTLSHTQSAIEKVLYASQTKYAIPLEMPFDTLMPDLQFEILHNVKSQGKKYVIGALWGDTEGTFYEFSTAKEYLKFNPPVYRFLQRYHQVILRLNNYEWAKFLAKNNPVPLDLISAIETVTQRNNLTNYLKILELYTEYNCFYCGKPLDRIKPHVDHFIPWSYIHSDNLWNLVLACSECNLSKSDRLPGLAYLAQLQERNLKLQEFTVDSIQSEFAVYQTQKLTDLYNYASANGFRGDWQPKRE